MSNTSLIPQELALENHTDAIRRVVGRGKAWSASDLSEATGIPERTIQSYRAGKATPGRAFEATLMTTLPPIYAADLLALSGLGGVVPVEPMAYDVPSIMSELAGQLQRIAARLADDGRFCHVDRANTKPELETLALTLLSVAVSMAEPTEDAVRLVPRDAEG